MKIYTVSGYNEVGKNMTVLDLGDDAIILDAGAHIPALIELQEENE
jgi:mRNA degradation ribonuclease J1/J2